VLLLIILLLFLSLYIFSFSGRFGFFFYQSVAPRGNALLAIFGILGFGLFPLLCFLGLRSAAIIPTYADCVHLV